MPAINGYIFFELPKLDFNLINVNKPIKVAGLAEGPGGFIEAIINYRKKFKNTII